MKKFKTKATDDALCWYLVEATIWPCWKQQKRKQKQRSTCLKKNSKNWKILKSQREKFTNSIQNEDLRQCPCFHYIIRTLCIYGEQMYYFVGFLRRQKYKVKNIPKNAKTNFSEAMYQKTKIQHGSCWERQNINEWNQESVALSTDASVTSRDGDKPISQKTPDDWYVISHCDQVAEDKFNSVVPTIYLQ